MILLDPAAKPVVAHRGYAAHAPENTLEALRRAVIAGADALEIDVQLTRDGHVVLFHDLTVDRTTNGRGAVAALTLAELRRLDAGYRFSADGGRSFPWRARGVVVPTLGEVLEEFAHMPLIIELKTVPAAPVARRLLERHAAASRTLVGSFFDRALAVFRGSGFAHAASRAEVVRLYARAALPGAPARLPYHALCIPPVFRGLPVPVMRLARLARAAGVRTHVWTVDEPGRARRYWEGDVNAIITNDPARIRGARLPEPGARSPC
jgi:glycerophosphoryl diester phosphodiesterase